MGAVAAIVLGAGSGARVGAAVNKVYLRLGDEPMLVHSARAFAEHPEVDELCVVAAADELDVARETLRAAGVRCGRLLAGGATRHASERAALDALRPRIETGEIGFVVIHDGARPLVDRGTITRTLAAAREAGGAIAAQRVRRPLAVVHDGVVTGLRAPGGLWRAQTPQAFAAAPLLEAFERAREDGVECSDTAMAVERLGVAVRVVDGGERNLKVTYPADVLRAERLLGA